MHIIKHPSPALAKAKLLSRYELNQERYAELKKQQDSYLKWLEGIDETHEHYDQMLTETAATTMAMNAILEDNIKIAEELLSPYGVNFNLSGVFTACAKLANTFRARVVVAIPTLVFMLSSCTVTRPAYAPGDTVAVKSLFRKAVKFRIDKTLPGGYYSAFNLETNTYVQKLGYINLKPVSKADSSINGQIVKR